MKVPNENVIFSFKIVIVGSGGVGKTCLFNRYCFNSFNFNTDITIGINFYSTYHSFRFKNDDTNNERYIVNSIFDFGGQERFKPLIPRFLDGADGALLVFDSVSFSSFQNLDYWYEKLDKEIPIILVGSKNDLIDKTPKAEIVSDDSINNFLKNKNIEGFYRSSALENYNVLIVFKELIKKMLLKKKIEVIII